MNPAFSGEHPTADVLTRLARLEEWRAAVKNDSERAEARGLDFEARLRVLEAAHMKMTGKITVLAVFGSALATGAVQLLLKVMG